MLLPGSLNPSEVKLSKKATQPYIKDSAFHYSEQHKSESVLWGRQACTFVRGPRMQQPYCRCALLLATCSRNEMLFRPDFHLAIVVYILRLPGRSFVQRSGAI